MSTLLMAAATFGGVLVAVLACYWLLLVRPEAAARARLRGRTATDESLVAPPCLVRPPVRFSGFEWLEHLLRRSGRVGSRVQALLDRAGSGTTVGTFLLACACAGLLGLILVAWRVGPVPFSLAGVLAGVAPIAWMRRAATRRTRLFEEQFPDALDLLGRGLRAGHGFGGTLGAMARELPRPIASEFERLYERQRFGTPLPDALREFTERVPLLDARFFSAAVLTQRDVGGNLADVLEGLAAVVRDRFKVQRQVRVISAQGRLTGAILMAMPPVLGIGLTLLNPERMALLVNDPIGRAMLAGGLGMQAVGMLLIHRIVNVEY